MTHRPETSEFATHMGRVGEALDRFVAFDHPDAVASIDQWRPALDGPLPQTGVGADAVIDEFLDVVLPAGSRVSDPRFWAFITAGPSTVPAVVAAAAQVGGVQRYTITAFNQLEELSLTWLAELCGLSPTMEGVYSSGGSVANLLALGAARQAACEAHGVDPASEGLGGASLRIYASSEAHHTIQRAAGVLGIGRRAVQLVPIDSAQRMDPVALDAMLAADIAAGCTPVAVVATAGTTNTGAIDPLRSIGEIARRHGAWFHVDGAYGLPGILDERVAPLYDGLELADSAIVDPHKWLGAPSGIGATFVRDRAVLYRALTQEPADYLQGSFGADDDVAMSFDAMGIPYADFGVELTAPPRGVVVWSILREIGVEGLRQRIVEDNDRARRIAELADAHPRLESLTTPTLSIACFRYVAPDGGDSDELNRHLLRRLRRTTSFLPSSTVLDGAFVIRPCFINVRTVDEDIEAFVEAVVRIGDELVGSRAGTTGDVIAG